MLIFSDFVSDATLLLYKKPGGDSVNQIYPILVHLSVTFAPMFAS